MPTPDLITIVGGKVRTDLKCSACDLCKSTELVTNCMEGSGNRRNPVFAVVGHGPGSDDDGIGSPFTGPNGGLLKDLLAEASIPEDWCFFTNCTRCATHGRGLKEHHWRACRDYFLRDMREIKPQAIIAMGAQAFTWLTGYGNVSKFHRHGIPYSFDRGINVFPITQPAAIFHVEQNYAKQAIRTEIVEDLRWLRHKALQPGGLTELDEIPRDYKWASTIEEALAIFDELDAFQGVLASDLETATEKGEPSLVPEPGNVVASIGFSTGPGHGRAIPLYAWGQATLHWWTDDELERIILPRVQKLLREKTVYGHNFLQYDQKWVRFQLGVERLKIDFDTQQAHYLLHEEPPHDLESLAMAHTTMQAWKRSFTIKNTKLMCEYLCKDVDAIARLRAMFEPLLDAEPRLRKLLDELYIPLGHELCNMEQKGVLANSAGFEVLRKDLDGKIAQELIALRQVAEVQRFEFEKNTQVQVTSTKHIADIMENYLKLPKLKGGETANGAYSTADWVLNAYRHVPFVRHLQATRRLYKLKGTYCDGMEKHVAKDGAIHTHYLMHGTVTARLSSSGPNLQNIPRPDTAGAVLEDGNAIKNLFGCRDGRVLLQIDYSQAELRDLADQAQETAMLEVFARGGDIHTATAAMVYAIEEKDVTKAQRVEAKRVNFGIVYGMQLETMIEKFADEEILAAQKKREKDKLPYLTEQEKQTIAADAERRARFFWETHKTKYPKLWAWMEKQVEIAKQQNWLETRFGHKRRFGYMGQHEENQAKNFKIQSEAGVLTLYTLIRTAKAFRDYGIDAYPILTVHDSIVYEVKLEDFWKAAKVIKMIAETPLVDWLNVPMTVDMEAGFSWGSMKEIDTQEWKVAA